jgi:spore maturation protein CgeB
MKKDINISSTLRCGYNRKRAIINDIVKDLNMPDIVIGEVSKGHSSSTSTDEQKLYYYKILARSKISISYPGLGWDTGRFWEILANKCLLFSPEISIKIPDPLIAFKHYIPYEERDLKKKLLHYLNHEDEMNEIALAGYDHLLKYHTSKVRAEYLIKKIC